MQQEAYMSAVIHTFVLLWRLTAGGKPKWFGSCDTHDMLCCPDKQDTGKAVSQKHTLRADSTRVAQNMDQVDLITCKTLTHRTGCCLGPAASE